MARTGSGKSLCTWRHWADGRERVGIFTARITPKGRRDAAVASLAVSPLGYRVFITGQSSGGDTPTNYVTIAYAA
jgi:hypothetical protein